MLVLFFFYSMSNPDLYPTPTSRKNLWSGVAKAAAARSRHSSRARNVVFRRRKTKLLHLDFTGRDAVSNFNECDWQSSVKNLHRRNATSSRRARICVCLCQVAAVPTPSCPTLFSCILFCLPFTAHGCIAQ